MPRFSSKYPSLNHIRLFVTGTLISIVATCASSSFAQLSQNSGINANDTYAVFDVTVQSYGGSYQYSYKNASGQQAGALPATVAFPHYHVEIGFDSTDNLVANITPLDASGMTGFQAADFVGAIQIRGNDLTFLDGNGNQIQFEVPIPGSVIAGMIQPKFSAGISLNAMLAPGSPTVAARVLGGSVTGTNATGPVVTMQTTHGAVIFQYQSVGPNILISTITTTRTSQTFGSVTDTKTFSNLFTYTIQTGTVDAQQMCL